MSMKEVEAGNGEDNHVHMKAKSRWLTVEPILFLAYIGNGTVSTIRSQYLQQRIGIDKYNYTFSSTESNHTSMPCITNSSDPHYITQHNIQHDVSNWTLYLSICGCFPLLFASIIIGTWSDKAGRKTAIAIPLTGMIVQSFFYLLTIALYLPLPVLIIGELSYGMTGGGPLLTAASLSYIADVTTVKERTFRVIIAETMLLLSIGVSQLFMGYFIAATGFGPPFYLIIACHTIALGYTMIPKALYESIEKQTESTLSTRGRLIKLSRDIFDLFAYNANGRRWRLLLIASMFIAIILSTYGYISVFPLYAIGPPFCWSAVLVGIYMSLSLFVSAVGSVAGFKLFGIWLSDIWILHITMASTIISMAMLGFTTETVVVFLASAVGSLKSLSTPIIRSMASKYVSANEQGAMFSFLASMESTAVFFSPVMFQPLYAATIVNDQQGASFLLAAGFGVLAAIIGSILHFRFWSTSPYSRMPGERRKPITLDNL